MLLTLNSPGRWTLNLTEEGVPTLNGMVTRWVPGTTDNTRQHIHLTATDAFLMKSEPI